jgi:uncharacterized protein (TIGR03437 family)
MNLNRLGTYLLGGTVALLLMTANAAAQSTFTIVVNTVGGDGTFPFLIDVSNPASVTTSSGTGSFTEITFQGGPFSLTETVPAGWTLTSSSCTTGTPASFSAPNTCTFNNTIVPGSITVVKNTLGADGAFPFTSNFGLISPLTTVSGTVSQTVSGLAPGSGYTVSETVPSGWTQIGASCNNGSISGITVLPGVNTICTFTNVQQGSITLVKNTVGGNGTFAFTSNFGLTSLTTAGNTASQTFSNLTANNLILRARGPSPAGGISAAYNVSEIVPSGWIQTGATCTSGTPTAVLVAPGATTTCTFTNVQQGSIKVVKNTVGGNGTFTFTSNFGLTSLTTAGNTASQTFSNLTANNLILRARGPSPAGPPMVSYNVSEIVPSGWTQTGATCTNGTPAAVIVAPGATTTCTFTNTKPAPPPAGVITVVKNTIGGNGTFAFTSNFGLASLTTVGGTASQTFPSLTPGSAYSVSETVPAGWTQTSATCTNGTPAAITVVAGALTVCVITNTSTTATPLPTVSSTFPANGATLVTPSANVVANFGQLVPPQTMSTVSITVQQGTTPVPGTVTYSGTFTTFTPTNNLAPNTLYTATLTSTATSPAGSPPAASYKWSFTTGSSADQTAVCLANFAVLSGSAIVNTGSTAITGDVGVSPGSSVSGFPPGTFTGTIHAGDSAAAQGILDLSAAYGDAVSRLIGAVSVAGDLGGQTFTSGLYNSVSSLSISSGNLTLDAKGDPNAVFIFQIASTLTTAAGNQVILVGGASASNVFWQVGTSAILGTNSIFNGSILADQAITLNAGATVNGRLLAQNGAVTLQSNIITSPPPSISVGGIINAASDAQTVAAGSIVSVFGHNLGSSLMTATGYPLSNALGESSFQVGTQAAPPFMTSCSQANLQIPWAAVGQVPVTATVGGLVSTVEIITVAPFAPGIFSLNQAGTGQGAVEIASTSQLAAPPGPSARPVAPGEYIAIFATGLGAVSNQPATGAAALSDPLSSTLTTPTVTIGSVAAQVTYSGLAPGFAGLYQVNALVPDGVPSGDAVNLVISIGGAQSNTVTIAVQ